MIRTWAFPAIVPGSIPGRGTKIPQATWPKQTKKYNENLCIVILEIN